MFLIQRVDPNKVRFWKSVVDQEQFWKPIYLPLERLDRILLHIFPQIKWLCWNVVVLAHK